MYESNDGLFRGTLDDCLAYEAVNGSTGGAGEEPRVHACYESDDGRFRGTLEAVQAYEARAAVLYASGDGKVTGTLGKVLAYEADGPAGGNDPARAASSPTSPVEMHMAGPAGEDADRHRSSSLASRQISPFMRRKLEAQGKDASGGSATGGSARSDAPTPAPAAPSTVKRPVVARRTTSPRPPTSVGHSDDNHGSSVPTSPSSPTGLPSATRQTAGKTVRRIGTSLDRPAGSPLPDRPAAGLAAASFESCTSHARVPGQKHARADRRNSPPDAPPVLPSGYATHVLSSISSSSSSSSSSSEGAVTAALSAGHAYSSEELRLRFLARAKADGRETLDRASLAALMGEMLRDAASPAPSAADLALAIADDDRSGDVDVFEFIRLFNLVRAGKAPGRESAVAGAGPCAQSGGVALRAGDTVAWVKADDDLPEGTVGRVLCLHDDGDVEVLFPTMGAAGAATEVVFTFAAEHLALVGGSSSEALDLRRRFLAKARAERDQAIAAAATEGGSDGSDKGGGGDGGDDDGGGGGPRSAANAAAARAAQLQATDDDSHSLRLPKASFAALVNEVLAARGVPTSSAADLDAAFTIADANGSGDVDVFEFIGLFHLVRAGKAHGLGGRFSTFGKLDFKERLRPTGLNGLTPGDVVTWRSADADLPEGTVGHVLCLHDDGDVEVLFTKPDRDEAVFTFSADRLESKSNYVLEKRRKFSEVKAAKQKVFRWASESSLAVVKKEGDEGEAGEAHGVVVAEEDEEEEENSAAAWGEDEEEGGRRWLRGARHAKAQQEARGAEAWAAEASATASVTEQTEEDNDDNDGDKGPIASTAEASDGFTDHADDDALPVPGGASPVTPGAFLN